MKAPRDDGVFYILVKKSQIVAWKMKKCWFPINKSTSEGL
jgi:hypothetical protein